MNLGTWLLLWLTKPFWVALDWFMRNVLRRRGWD